MRKGSSSTSSMPEMPSLGVGATVLNTCSANDESLFCKFSRGFQVLAWIVSISLILYVIYAFVWPFVSQKMKGLKLFKGSKR